MCRAQEYRRKIHFFWRRSYCGNIELVEAMIVLMTVDVVFCNFFLDVDIISFGCSLLFGVNITV